jgi:hypothetical protein
MLAAACILLSVGTVRPADAAQAWASEVGAGAAGPPAWRGRAAQAPPSPGCASCDAFASGEGFFSVAVDCLNRSIPPERRMKYLHDERWISTQLGGCLASLISSLGTARPASFFRQGLPAETAWGLLGVVVGRRAGAEMAGALASDANFVLDGALDDLPPCQNESSYAQERARFTELLCGKMEMTALQAVFAKSSLNCKFSGLEAMVAQQSAFNRLSQCDGAWEHNSVSLRYGVGDVTGVLFTAPEHEPLARDFALWLGQLLGRPIELVHTVPNDRLARCECLAVNEPGEGEAGQVSRPLNLPPLGLPAVPTSGHDFCTEHWCDTGWAGHLTCCTSDVVEPEIDPSLNQVPKYHPMFLHIPKTGGSSIECLTKDWDESGMWTNMGHASFPAVSRCARRAQPFAQQALIMTVRNPYDYWLSVYEYAVVCIQMNSKASLTANYLKKQDNTRILESFGTFMGNMSSNANALFVASQTHHIERICGTPCDFTFLLRTESLDADWLALLGQLHLPLRPLTHVNVAAPTDDAAEVRKKVYTTELAAIVRRIEPDMFDKYGYAREL